MGEFLRTHRACDNGLLRNPTKEMNITLTTVLVMVAIVLLGSAFRGSWARLRREKPGENQQAQKLTIEDVGMPTSIASVKFIALDGAHSLEPRDIVNVLQHGALTTRAMRR